MSSSHPVAAPGSELLRFLAEQTLARCDELARCTDTPGVITRTFLSPAMKDAHRLVGDWMREAGLEVRLDPAGNLVGRRGGSAAPAFLLGSHLDTVPNAGRYDGILGVLAGIAVARALRDHPLPFALEVVGFSEEEGVRYRRPYLGSTALAGSFDPVWLGDTDADGIPMAQAFRNFGLDPDRIAAAARRPEEVLGFLELHIEQGPVLEELGASVGIVEAIVGQERLLVSFKGSAGHAGTVPMDRRRDAAVGAARLVLAAREMGISAPGLRATVGSLALLPNVRNVIPGEARLSLDIRHADDGCRRRAVEELLEEAHRIARGEGLQAGILQRSAENAVPMDAELRRQLGEIMAASGRPVVRLVSGAGHDAAVMASVCPSAMLFVQNARGISHHPDESVALDDVTAALEVMAGFLLASARQARSASA